MPLVAVPQRSQCVLVGTGSSLPLQKGKTQPSSAWQWDQVSGGWEAFLQTRPLKLRQALPCAPLLPSHLHRDGLCALGSSMLKLDAERTGAPTRLRTDATQLLAKAFQSSIQVSPTGGARLGESHRGDTAAYGKPSQSVSLLLSPIQSMSATFLVWILLLTHFSWGLWVPLEGRHDILLAGRRVLCANPCLIGRRSSESSCYYCDFMFPYKGFAQILTRDASPYLFSLC